MTERTVLHGPHLVAVTLLGVLLVFGCKGEKATSWAVSFGGPDHASFGGDVGTDIAVASDGSVYVTGVLTGSATFGKGENRETELSAVGYLWKSVFLAKFKANGRLSWATVSATTDRPDSPRIDRVCNRPPWPE